MVAPSLVERPAGIERLQQRLAHVKLFAERLERAPIAEPLQPRHVFHLGWNLFDEWPFHIFVRHDVFDQHRFARVCSQPGPRLRIEHPVRLQALCVLERSNRLTRVLTVSAVDLAGREPCAVEQHLGLHHRRIDSLRRLCGLCAQFGAVDGIHVQSGGTLHAGEPENGRGKRDRACPDHRCLRRSRIDQPDNYEHRAHVPLPAFQGRKGCGNVVVHAARIEPVSETRQPTRPPAAQALSGVFLSTASTSKA